jgi:hypothetical protein
VERFVLCRFLFLSLLISPLSTLAWFDIGHEVVGEIAWNELNDKTRAQVKELLAQLSMHKEASSLATVATLPDHIRTSLKVFDSWHYIALPYVTIPGDAPPAPVINNAVWALCECTRTLTTAKGYERAFMLPFFAHIVGDLHQPLHAATRVSPMLPQGDQNGNFFPIRVEGSISNLHLYWDSGLGYFSDVREKWAPNPTKSPKTEGLAASIMKEFPRAHFGKKIEEVSFRGWAQDSHELAKSVAYNLAEGSEPHQGLCRKRAKARQGTCCIGWISIGIFVDRVALRTRFVDACNRL